MRIYICNTNKLKHKSEKRQRARNLVNFHANGINELDTHGELTNSVPLHILANLPVTSSTAVLARWNS